MNFVLQATLATVLLAIGCVRLADAECCYVPYDCKEKNGDSSHRCADCSEATIYCGVGQCNVFGCNCDGGCRKGNDSLWCWNPAFCHHRTEAEQNVLQLIKLYDSNQDSALDKEEFETLLEKLPINGGGGGGGEFETLDANSDGLISLSEIDRDHFA